jgi:hypothetical protein
MGGSMSAIGLFGLLMGVLSGQSQASAPQPPQLTLALTLCVQVGAPMELGEVTKKLLAGEAVDPAQVYFKTVPTFETAAPELQWLTRAIFVGTGERYPTEVVIRVWKVD